MVGLDHMVEDIVERRLAYIPSTKHAAKTRGPAVRTTMSPYSVMTQNAHKSRKLSHGSFVVQDKSPATLFRGCMNVYEYASARVI